MTDIREIERLEAKYTITGQEGFKEELAAYIQRLIIEGKIEEIKTDYDMTDSDRLDQLEKTLKALEKSGGEDVQALFDESMKDEEVRAKIWKLYEENKDWFPCDTMPKTQPFFDIWKTIKEIANERTP